MKPSSRQQALAAAAARPPPFKKYFLQRALRRFAAKYEVDRVTGCWVWKGATQTKGRPSFGAGKKGVSVLAHRWSYENYGNRKIPPGHELKMKCDNDLCVNFAHMECVSAAEARRRGTSPFAVNAQKTHCIHGHELKGKNLIIRKDGRRRCRTCDYRRGSIYGKAKTAKRRAESRAGLAPESSLKAARARDATTGMKLLVAANEKSKAIARETEELRDELQLGLSRCVICNKAKPDPDEFADGLVCRTCFEERDRSDRG